MNKYSKYLIGLGSLSLPMLASAATGSNVLNIIELVAVILNKVVGVVIILALIWFIWGLAVYIEEGSGSAAKRGEGRERMIMGTIVFFVIISIWGLVRFLQVALGINPNDIQLHQKDIPDFVPERQMVGTP